MLKDESNHREVKFQNHNQSMKDFGKCQAYICFPSFTAFFFRVWGIINNKECLKEEKSAKIMVNNK